MQGRFAPARPVVDAVRVRAVLAVAFRAAPGRAGKVVFEKTADFSDGIKAGAGGQFPIGTTVEAPRFELEHEDGKIEGDTGKSIEKL